MERNKNLLILYNLLQKEEFLFLKLTLIALSIIKNLLVMTRNFYAKSVNITMKTLSEDYFLYLKIKRLGSLHLIQGESIEPWMYVR